MEDDITKDIIKKESNKQWYFDIKKVDQIPKDFIEKYLISFVSKETKDFITKYVRNFTSNSEKDG